MTRAASVPTANGRIEWLDLMRGVAAIAVVFYHYQDYLRIRHVGLGFIAVDIFFVLSGLVLGQRYTDAIRGGMGFRQFALVRLRRLYPMVVIAGVFVVLVSFVRGMPGGSLSLSDPAVWSVFMVLPSAQSDTGLGFPADGPMWSLWAELVINVIWYWIVRTRPRWLLPVWVLSVVVLVIAARQANTLNVGWQPGAIERLLSIARAFAWFGVGYRMATMRPMRMPRAVVTTLALIVAAGAAAAALPGQRWLGQTLIAAFGAAFLQVLYLARPPASWLGRAAQWLGLLSYPLYLMHFPAIRLLRYVDPYVNRWTAAALVVGVCTFIATVLNERIVEALQRSRRQRLERSKQTSGLA